MPLPRPVLLMTRPVAASQAFVADVHAALGRTTDHLISPLMQIVPLPMADNTHHSGLVFTSAHGVQAARDAMAHAGIDGAQVDGIFVGLFNNGFSAQDFAAGLALQADPGLRFKPATRVENACATGSAAIHAAQDFIRAGRGRVVLVIGAEQMSRTAGDKVGDLLLGASYRREEGNIPGGFAGVFGQIAQAYFAKNGEKRKALIPLIPFVITGIYRSMSDTTQLSPTLRSIPEVLP